MLEIFRKPETTYPINPRYRAYGKARIDIAKRAVTRGDWDRLWKKSTHPFPFSWGSSWKQCIEYKVADFPAEVGFFIDILGFPVNAFDPDYAMFTSPSGDFYFSVVPTKDGESATPPEAIRLQFMVENITDTALELQRRGVKFDQMPSRVADNSAFLISSFHTPHGIGIELWGFDARFDHRESAQKAEISKEEKKPSKDTPAENSIADQISGDALAIKEPAALEIDHHTGQTDIENVTGEIEYGPDEEF
ncbi:MAG: VOC family protein [Anaerolineales bacterium]